MNINLKQNPESENEKIIKFEGFKSKLLNGGSLSEKCSWLELGAIEGAAEKEMRHCTGTSKEDREYPAYLREIYQDAISYVGFKEDDVYGWDGEKPL